MTSGLYPAPAPCPLSLPSFASSPCSLSLLSRQPRSRLVSIPHWSLGFELTLAGHCLLNY
ncbi:hypothetical protein CGRA01v4_07143 [Colletotrichum graminicola]|nr:hypothetical protein CGRA01v4_07143 [Colletotrichum graminicola]